MTKRPVLIGTVTVTAGLLIWRLREQGKLETTFLENGVEPELATDAAERLIPLFSCVTYSDVVGQYQPTTEASWQTFALAAAGEELVLLDD
tara:strand:+ start:350 stop:622 length:273 start_codon:yes stop_codon:yes gene_type:complete